MPFTAKRILVAAGILAATAAGSAGIAFASEGAQPTVDAAFVPLDEVVVPVVGSNRIEGTLRIRMVVAVADAASATEVSARVAELRAASVAAAVEHSRLYVSAVAPVNAEQLRSDMDIALKETSAAVGNVLLTEVSAFSI